VALLAESSRPATAMRFAPLETVIAAVSFGSTRQ
jgi:hypothetical protein